MFALMACACGGRTGLLVESMSDAALAQPDARPVPGAANLALPSVEITLAGGPLAVWLQDSPYVDNVPGPNGRSPTWELECAR